jgi:two-component system, OmpR family, alkaline phosphatase synthesis response regulator PhoP
MEPLNPNSKFILVAEDEEITRRAILRSLQLRGYSVKGVSNGRDVLEFISNQRVDLILLDIRMPDVDGIQVLKWMQEKMIHIPVIILTAYASTDSAIAAVKAGAADYLIKPQSIKEIHAVIEKTLLKKQKEGDTFHLVNLMEEALSILKTPPSDDQSEDGPARATDSTTIKRLIVDRPELNVIINPNTPQQRVVPLTLNQVDLLQYFIDHTDRVLKCAQIATGALHYPNLNEDEAQNIIRPHILRLRRKIEDDPAHPTFIQTIRNGGYRFSG